MAGFLLDAWLGAVIGIALYAASRLFALAEEADPTGRFGPQWDAYCHMPRSRGCDGRAVSG